MRNERIRQIDLAGCPLGNVFDVRAGDWSVEEAHFAGWTDTFANPTWPRANSLWRVVDESDGERSLEYPFKGDAALWTADALWRDYSITALVRQLHSASANTPDDEYQSVARSGIIFRCHDIRQYYFLCLEGLNRVVLYHRLDETHTELAAKKMAVDRARYYRLQVGVEGARIRCELDGEPIFDVRDDRLATGKAGLRTTCLARYRDVRVEMTESAHPVYVQTRDRQARELDALRSTFPKPVHCKTIPIPTLDSGVRFGRLTNPQRTELVVTTRSEKTPAPQWDRLVILDLDGNTLWEMAVNKPRPTSNFGAGVRVADVNGDGLEEIIVAVDGKMKLLRGTDGTVLKEAPLPRGGAYGVRGAEANITGIYAAQWKPSPAHKGFVLTEEYGSDGGNCIIALDDDLRLLWHFYSLPVNYGHVLDVCDMDGDGRDEVLAGYHLVNAEGEQIWKVEGCDYFDVQQGARHPDIVSAADYNGDGQPEVAYAGSGEGFMLVDGRTGQIIVRRTIGHAQRIYGGKFRPDLKGIEISCGTRWGNPGIICFFSGHGELLHRFQPDSMSEAGPAVNWAGNGQELMILTSSWESLGLWDAHGRRVVDRWIPESEFGQLTRGCRMSPSVCNLAGDERDEIVLTKPGKLEIYTQDRPFSGDRIYAPIRRETAMPGVSFPAWKPRQNK